MIPAGSIMQVDGKNYTMEGETPTDVCYMDSSKGASMYTCNGATGQYIAYNGNVCNKDQINITYNITINGNCYSDRCIGYNDVMYKYNGTSYLRN